MTSLDEHRLDDIEIYVQNLDLKELSAWLKGFFPRCQFEPKENQSRIRIDLPTQEPGKSIELIVLMKAAAPNFSCIWFKSTATPWNNDLDCAQSYFNYAKKEVRCASAPWLEADDHKHEQWWQINSQGRQLIEWQ